MAGDPCARPGDTADAGGQGRGSRGQSGVPGRGQVDDYGRVHGLVVHSAHGCVHVGGCPIRHDTIPWKVNTRQSGPDSSEGSPWADHVRAATAVLKLSLCIYPQSPLRLKKSGEKGETGADGKQSPL